MQELVRRPLPIPALALLLALTDCMGARAPEALSESPLLELSLPPSELERGLRLSQVITGESRGHVYSLRVELEITPERLVMIGLTHLGVVVFTLEQDADGIHLDAPGMEQFPFDPRYMLLDVKLTWWPGDILNRALRPLAMRLEIDDQGHRRRILGPAGAPLVEIEFPAGDLTDGDISLRHYDIPYRLRIKMLSVETDLTSSDPANSPHGMHDWTTDYQSRP